MILGEKQISRPNMWKLALLILALDTFIFLSLAGLVGLPLWLNPVYVWGGVPFLKTGYIIGALTLLVLHWTYKGVF